MAAQTAATSLRESVGSMTLHIFTFTSVAGGSSTGDTFASGLGTTVVDFWAQDKTLSATQTSAGINVSNSSGTFTMSPAVDGAAVSLFVLAKD